MNVLKIKQMGKRGLKLRVDKKTRNKMYTAMAYLRRHGYVAKGRDVLLKEGSPSPKEHEYLVFLMEQGYCISHGEIS